MQREPDHVTRLHIAAAALLAGLQSLVFNLGSANLGDTDPYRHLQYAHQLWLSRFTLRGHPFLPFTDLATQGVDLWWGFHLLLVPFSFFGVEWGAQLAGVAIAAASAGGMAWIAARMGQPRPAWFVLVPFVVVEFFAVRAHVARPAYLTPPLAFACLAAGTGHLRARTAGIAALIHGWLHLSAPLSPAFAILGAGCALLTDRTSWRTGLRAVLAALLGLALSVGLRPDRANFLSVAWSMTHVSLGGLPGGHLPQGGGEGASPGLAQWTWMALGPLLALLLAIKLGRGRERAGDAAARLASLVAAAITGAMAFQVQKFIDYQMPALALASALWWPAELDPRSLLERPRNAGILSLLLMRTLWFFWLGWESDAALFPTTPALEMMAQKVRAQVPPGAMLFVDDWGWAEILYGFLPEYRYPVAYDPATLYGASHAKFWIWEHASADGAFCDQPLLDACPDARSSPEDIARAMKAFGAEWVVARGNKSPRDLFHVVSSAPEWFEPVAEANAGRERFTVWHLKHPAP